MIEREGNFPPSEPVLPIPGQQAASLWEKADAENPDEPAPPPLWTRYIDPRFKQDCSN